MSISKLFEEFKRSADRPNHFTWGMGELIRKARGESGYSQRSLSEKLYIRQATLSDIENGKTEPDAETLLLLSHFLNKPITYFFPEPFKPDRQLSNIDLNELEKELLLQIRRLSNEDLHKILAQVKAIADLSNQ
jgi:transcriptional regulator with XRE-family HTH domain